MVDIEKFDNRTSDEFVVRTSVDDNGDYKFEYYDIISVTKSGKRICCGGFDNKIDAEMFAASPLMIAEIKALRRKVEKLESQVTTPTDKSCGFYHSLSINL